MVRKLFILIFCLSLSILNCCFAQNFNTNLPLPGTSMANIQLQHDTLKPVYMAIGTIARNCENMKVTNTKVTKQPYNLKYRGPQIVAGLWEELWSVNACSKTYNVPVKFILDETGASYMISPKDIYQNKN